MIGREGNLVLPGGTWIRAWLECGSEYQYMRGHRVKQKTMHKGVVRQGMRVVRASGSVEGGGGVEYVAEHVCKNYVQASALTCLGVTW